MFGSYRAWVLTCFVLLAPGLSSCFCPGVFGPAPEIECPDSVEVGEDVTLTVRNVDDSGLSWQQQSEDTARGSFVVDGNERDEFVGAEPDTRTQHIVFRAQRAGMVTITAEEVFIGPAMCLPPYPEMSVAECTIVITDQSSPA